MKPPGLALSAFPSEVLPRTDVRLSGIETTLPVSLFKVTGEQIKTTGKKDMLLTARIRMGLNENIQTSKCNFL